MVNQRIETPLAARPRSLPPSQLLPVRLGPFNVAHPIRSILRIPPGGVVEGPLGEAYIQYERTNLQRTELSAAFRVLRITAACDFSQDDHSCGIAAMPSISLHSVKRFLE